MGIDIPSNIKIFDFSRRLNKNNNSKLVALTFSEVRNEEEDESRIMEQLEEEKESEISSDDDEPHFNQKYIIKDKENKNKFKLHDDVKWICNLLLFAHKLTFDVIETLDLSHNAWDELDIVLIADSILRRDNALNVKQIYFDGIPMLNELKKSNKAITMLFKAIAAKCHKLEFVSLAHCLLRDQSCDIIKSFYAQNPKTKLIKIDLINNNITERGVDVLDQIQSIVTKQNAIDLAFVLGSFYSNNTNKWNQTIKTEDDY